MRFFSLLMIVVCSALRDIAILPIRQGNVDGSSSRYFLAKFQLGSPSQNVNLIADTGSWQPLVYSASCSQCGEGAVYNSSLSSSYTDEDGTFQISFGAGNVYFGACSDLFLPLPNISFGLVWKTEIYDPRFIFGPMGGIIGLGLPSFANSPDAGQFPPIVPINNLLSVKGLRLNSQRLSLLTVLPLGSATRWTPLQSEPYWFIGITQISINGHVSSSCSSAKPCKALVDSGAGATVFSNVVGLSGPVSCENAPTLMLTFLGVPSAITFSPPSYLDKINGECYSNLVVPTSSVPLSAARIRVADDGTPNIVLGASFFDAVPMILDAQNKRIGFE